MLLFFITPGQFRHLCQHNLVIFLQRRLICAAPFNTDHSLLYRVKTGIWNCF